MTPVDTPPNGRRAPRQVPSQPTMGDRLSIQIEVIKALMVRFILAKYGRGNLGFFWMIVEPIFLLTGVIIIWTVLHPSGGHGVNVAAFVISGYVPLTLWRHLSSSVRVMSFNYGLLYHRRITVFDIMIARTLAEIAAVGAAGGLVYFLLLSVGAVPWIEYPPLVLAGWLLMCWFGFGASCLVAGLSEKSEVLQNLIQPAQYLLMPISGCFFMVSWVPKPMQDLVLYVPLIHIYEIFRAGIFGRQVETHYSFSYIIIWSIGLTAVGMWSLFSSRRTLGSS